MMSQPNLEQLIASLAAEISQVPGVSAVVLGGSRARGTQTEKSDIDLGIYYHPERPLDLAALGRVAAQFDDARRADALTPLGGWGPWINGGGWLTVQGIAVDFIYRDLAKVTKIIDDCQSGRVEIFYQPGHPHGFVSSIYMAELAVCKLLWESDLGEVSALKAQTDPYPASLAQAIINSFAWEINFSLGIARKAVSRGDVVYACGCCFRAAMCLLQVLFALNGEYWLNEKGAVLVTEKFSLCPQNFRNRIELAFATLSPQALDIEQAIDLLDELSAEVGLILEKA